MKRPINKYIHTCKGCNFENMDSDNQRCKICLDHTRYEPVDHPKLDLWVIKNLAKHNTVRELANYIMSESGYTQSTANQLAHIFYGEYYR